MLRFILIGMLVAVTAIADAPGRVTWLSQVDAAEYLGVTTRTIREYIAKGILPASRVQGSRLIRIRSEDLDALLRPIPTTGGERHVS